MTPGQVARDALLAAQRKHDPDMRPTPWDELPQDYRDDWEGIAQAAIAAHSGQQFHSWSLAGGGGRRMSFRCSCGTAGDGITDAELPALLAAHEPTMPVKARTATQRHATMPGTR